VARSSGSEIEALRDKLSSYQHKPVSATEGLTRSPTESQQHASGQERGGPRSFDLRGTLSYERLFSLHLEGEAKDRGVFVFQGSGGEREGAQRRPAQASALLNFCSPYLKSSPQEASLSLSLELPPRSWLQTLVDLQPKVSVWVWIDEWPEGKTGSQLSEGYPCTLFYGEEGLRSLAVALYRLAPSRAHKELPDDPWWRGVAARAAQEEAESIRELMRSPQLPPYLAELCAARTQAWARRSSEGSWSQLAQAAQAVLNNSALSAAGSLTPLSQVQRAVEELKRVAAQWAERVMTHELLFLAQRLQGSAQVACLSQLREELPALTTLLDELNAEVTWFKHPQALLNKISSQHFDFSIILDDFYPWDGDDLTAELKRGSESLKVLCLTRRPSPVRVARSLELGCDALIDIEEGVGAVTLQLIKAFGAPQQASGMDDTLKRLRAIHQAQETQRLPLAYGLLIMETRERTPWLPIELMKLNLIRGQLLPKSLPAQVISASRVAICVAEVLLPTLQGFVKQVGVLSAKPIAGASLAEGGRPAEQLFTDALGRLAWARDTQQQLSWGHWRGGDAWGGLKGARASGQREEPKRLRGDGEQVLIIDSDPTSADALKFACEQEGLMVNVLTSSKAALDLLKRLPSPPALLIAECAPPQSDGLSLLREALSLPQGQPRVVLTVSVKRSALMREAFEAGAMDVITKPFQIQEATARVLYAVKRAPLR